MKKIFISLLSLAMSAAILSAQGNDSETYDYTGRFYLSVQGGAHVSASENAYSYRKEGRMTDLIKPQGYLSLGYDFSRAFGARFSLGYGSEAGAFNYKQSFEFFRPYTFTGIEAFADLVVNLKGLANKVGPFSPKLYAGLGYARTWGMEDAYDNYEPHWAEKYRTDPNNCFGFRGGFIAEYDFKCGFGLFCDLGAELFSDSFNGQNPRKWKDSAYYNPADPGFPLICARWHLWVSFTTSN